MRGDPTAPLLSDFPPIRPYQRGKLPQPCKPRHLTRSSSRMCCARSAATTCADSPKLRCPECGGKFDWLDLTDPTPQAASVSVRASPRAKSQVVRPHRPRRNLSPPILANDSSRTAFATATAAALLVRGELHLPSGSGRHFRAAGDRSARKCCRAGSGRRCIWGSSRGPRISVGVLPPPQNSPLINSSGDRSRHSSTKSVRSQRSRFSCNKRHCPFWIPSDTRDRCAASGLLRSACT